MFACLFLVSSAQNRMSPEILWQFGRISDPQVSPDGQKILYGLSHYNVPENKGNRNLIIAPVESSGSMLDKKKKGQVVVKLTDWEGSEYNARWRPDGQKIGFLSAKTGAPQMYECDPNGKNARQMTNVEGGIANFAYSPDMKYISFTIDVKMDKTVNELYEDLPMADARIIDGLMYRHWDSWHDYAYSHLAIMKYTSDGMMTEVKDLMPKEAYDTPLNPFGGDEQITWHPDGKRIAYVCKKVSGVDYAVSTNSDIYVHNVETGKVENLTQSIKGYDLDPSFSPDGSKMAWISMERDGFESDKKRLFVMDLASGKSEYLTEDYDNNVEHFTWSKDGKKIYFTTGVKATFQMAEINVSNKKMRQITRGTHNFYSVAEAGENLIGTKCSMSAPVEIFRVDKVSGIETPVTTENDKILGNMTLGKVEERTVKTTDGKDMLVWVIYPPDFDPNKKYPALLYCQGGPQSAVSQFFSYRWNFQLMAANDYIIVAPNRRGLPSFGQKWNDDISKDWGGQCMEDYLSAIDDVKKEPYVDENRLGAVGASFGGYSVYYLAGNHEKRFKTFISHAGLFNLEGWYGTTEEMFFANWDLGGNYWQSPQPKSYEQFSPHKFVGNWDTPILVIHGEKDFRVPITEGMQAFNIAQMQGIESKFLYYPDEGHWIQSPQNGVLWHRVFFDWLDKHLK